MTPPDADGQSRLVATAVRAIALDPANHGLVPITDLLEQTDLPVEDLHRVINDLRRRGVLSVSSDDGRHGLTPEQQRAALPEPGGRPAHYVSVKDPKKFAEALAKGPPPRPEVTKPAAPEAAAPAESPKVEASPTPAPEPDHAALADKATKEGRFGAAKIHEGAAKKKSAPKKAPAPPPPPEPQLEPAPEEPEPLDLANEVVNVDEDGDPATPMDAAVAKWKDADRQEKKLKREWDDLAKRGASAAAISEVKLAHWRARKAKQKIEDKVRQVRKDDRLTGAAQESLARLEDALHGGADTAAMEKEIRAAMAGMSPQAQADLYDWQTQDDKGVSAPPPADRDFAGAVVRSVKKSVQTLKQQAGRQRKVAAVPTRDQWRAEKGYDAADAAEKEEIDTAWRKVINKAVKNNLDLPDAVILSDPALAAWAARLDEMRRQVEAGEAATAGGQHAPGSVGAEKEYRPEPLPIRDDADEQALRRDEDAKAKEDDIDFGTRWKRPAGAPVVPPPKPPAELPRVEKGVSQKESANDRAKKAKELLARQAAKPSTPAAPEKAKPSFLDSLKAKGVDPATAPTADLDRLMGEHKSAKGGAPSQHSRLAAEALRQGRFGAAMIYARRGA